MCLENTRISTIWTVKKIWNTSLLKVFIYTNTQSITLFNFLIFSPGNIQLSY